MSGDNYDDVVRQMEQCGIEFRPGRDLPLRLDTAKRVTCGKGGKSWYRLSLFRPDAGGAYITGRFGSYKDGSSIKVEVDWTPLKEAERERMAAERKAKQATAERERQRLADEAAMSAAELWRAGAKAGASGYLQRKGVVGEACRYMADGSIIIPLLRYDLEREHALKGIQRIWGDGRKRFTKDFAKTGAALRLGEPPLDEHEPILFAEGYATGLSIRAGTEQRWPLFVVLDCFNLPATVEIMRGLYPDNPMLICADDDWRTMGNPGRAFAKKTAKFQGCHIVYPVFPPTCGRGEKDTDFNDLHRLVGLTAVASQVGGAVDMMRRHPLGR
jgi:putative DNA primase/helicase